MMTSVHAMIKAVPVLGASVVCLVLLASNVHAQDNAAILSLDEGAGNIFWPNGGDIPVIAFGWGSQRPLPIRTAVDSGYVPFFREGETTILTIQKRKDVFSDFLQQAFDEQMEIESATFTLDGITGEPSTYTLFDLRIVGVRDVGGFVAETRPTEEVVIAFTRMTLPGQ
jgi:hypothetical protein